MSAPAGADRVQCTGALESHGRRWRCSRPAAKKYGHKLCGFCASLHPRQCRHVPDVGFGAKTYHSALCFTQQRACDLSGVAVAGQDRKAGGR